MQLSVHLSTAVVLFVSSGVLRTMRFFQHRYPTIKQSCMHALG